jgi:hypothetical protein
MTRSPIGIPQIRPLPIWRSLVTPEHEMRTVSPDAHNPGRTASGLHDKAANTDKGTWGSPLDRSRRARTARCCGRGSRQHQDLVVTPVKWRPLKELMYCIARRGNRFESVGLWDT